MSALVEYPCANGKLALAATEPITDSPFPVELDMPPTKQDDMGRLIEAINANQAEIMKAIAGRRPPPWATLALSILAFLGAGMAWVGNSGYVVGGASSRIMQLEKDLATEKSLREKFEDEYKAKNQHMRDLYMLKFGEDPDTVDTSKIKRK